MTYANIKDKQSCTQEDTTMIRQIQENIKEEALRLSNEKWNKEINFKEKAMTEDNSGKVSTDNRWRRHNSTIHNRCQGQ